MNVTRYTIAVLALALIPTAVAAQWSQDPAENNPVCTESHDQSITYSVDDGAGGIIIVWPDTRTGIWKLFAQRLDADGHRLWAPDGVEVCTYPSKQFYTAVTTDMAGGVIVVWKDEEGTNVDIYAQRIDPAGNRLWFTDGLPVCTSAGDQNAPTVASDGAGGAVIAWWDERDDGGDVYAQRLNPNGMKLWNTAGVPVCDALGQQYIIDLTGDGAGGAIMCWRDASVYPGQVYARRVDSLGTPMWTEDGNQVCPSAGDQNSPQIISNGSGGCIIAWFEDDMKVMAQQLDAAGAILWDAAGVQLSSPSIDQNGLTMISDGDGGAFAAWDSDDGVQKDIYAQHVSAAGALRWSTASRLICNAPSDQFFARIVLDGTGGAIIGWVDYRDGVGSLYAQRADAFGNLLWAENGSVVNWGSTLSWPSAVADGQGGMIIAWQDHRSASMDIYAQRVDDTGYLGDPAPVLTAVEDFPNDQGGQVMLSWTASYLDAMPWHAVQSYSVWAREAGAKGLHQLEATEITALATQLGLPPAWIEAHAQAGWAFVLQLPATLSPEYGCFAPTFGDSTENGIPLSEYLVVGHGSDPWILWESTPLSGYSVDNLAPGAPLNLVGDWNAPTELLLSWEPSGHHDEDLALYRVYRGAASNFPLDASHLVGSSTEETYLDPIGTGTWYYRVTAVDVHGNEGEGSAELEVTNLTAVPEVMPEVFALHTNRPNPFNPRTIIGFDLPEERFVTLTVYALDGRRIATLVQESLPAGRHEVAWQGRDDLGRSVATGLYAYRIEAGDFRQTKKMILLR
jgi:hypothetical protein